jgi:hypothetical protein
MRQIEFKPNNPNPSSQEKSDARKMMRYVNRAAAQALVDVAIGPDETRVYRIDSEGRIALLSPSEEAKVLADLRGMKSSPPGQQQALSQSQDFLRDVLHVSFDADKMPSE